MTRSRGSSPRGDRSRRPRPVDPAIVRRRVLVLGGALGLLAILPLWKLVEVQVGDGTELVERGEVQRRRTVHIVPQRGSILDRNGTELAISLPRRSIGIEMPTLRLEGIDTPHELERFAHRLAELFDVDPEPLARRLVQAAPDAPWVQVADQVPIEVAERAVELLAAEGIEGALVSGPSTERVHPAGDSALRIIGTLTPDGPGERAGIERSYDEVLSGRRGRMTVETGVHGNTVPGTEHVVEEPVPGSDVMLTLDRTLQHEVEQILLRRADEAGATLGVAIVGRPGSGELLAVGSVERDDDGQLRLSSGPIAFSDVFQAGSVFKLVTVAAAVEAGLVDADHPIEVPDTLQVDDWVFSDHEEHPTEIMTVTDIVARSSNVGTIKIAQALGRQGLHDALTSFGFGRRTGVGHPAEDAGIVPPADQWAASDLAAAAIGTHQSGTALQLWAAYNVIANGGRYVQPRLVDAIIRPGGEREPVPSEPPRRVISEATAAEVGSMLEEVVQDGTGSMWKLPGYSVAAKTGTSRMLSDVGGVGGDPYMWSDHRYHYLAAFTGYLPAERPEVSITVILSDVHDGLTGSTGAGPAFSDLAKLSIRELGIAPSHLADGRARPGAADGELYRAAPAPARPADDGDGESR